MMSPIIRYYDINIIIQVLNQNLINFQSLIGLLIDGIFLQIVSKFSVMLSLRSGQGMLIMKFSKNNEHLEDIKFLIVVRNKREKYFRNIPKTRLDIRSIPASILLSRSQSEASEGRKCLILEYCNYCKKPLTFFNRNFNHYFIICIYSPSLFNILLHLPPTHPTRFFCKFNTQFTTKALSYLQIS